MTRDSNGNNTSAMNTRTNTMHNKLSKRSNLNTSRRSPLAQAIASQRQRRRTLQSNAPTHFKPSPKDEHASRRFSARRKDTASTRGISQVKTGWARNASL